MKLMNYLDLAQYTLFIFFDLSTLKTIHNGKVMLKSKSTTHVLTHPNSCKEIFA